jgi:hypothetical protein
MNYTEALDTLNRILHEERLRPTTGYTDDYTEFWGKLKGQPVVNMLGPQNPSVARPSVAELRKQKQRLVSEQPDFYAFGGANYDLLVLLFSQVPTDVRDQLFTSLFSTIAAGGYYVRKQVHHFPSYEGFVSDLPLIAEFCIRNGHAERVFSTAAAANYPTLGLAIMLMQLEETIALNSTLFSSQELRKIPEWLAPLRETAYLQTHSAKGSIGKMVPNPHYKSGREKEANQIVESIDGMTAECNQAIFFHLRGALQKTRNLEVESDKSKVEGYLKSLGFDPILQQALDQAEKEFRDDATGFELKTCMGHLRSFLEQLHDQACTAIAAPETAITEYNKWGLTIAFLKKNDYLSSQEEKLVSGIHAIMSEDGVHPLIAEREYVRLLRNMVIEYGLLLLSILEKKGISIRATPA